MLLLLGLLTAQTGDTLTIRALPHPPPPGSSIDSARLGRPSIQIETAQGPVRVWLLRAADTVFIAARIPDSTPSWGDDFVLSLDTRGDGAPSPQHDDFQWDFHRVLDSSVVLRGRNGRWDPPRDDPDWRLGSQRSGGGWEVSGRNEAEAWNLLLRLDPAWFEGEAGQWPRLAFRIYTHWPSGWYSWPPPQGNLPATTVERTPALWSPVR